MSLRLKGLYTALITPFDSQGNLDQNGLRELLRLQCDANVDGVVILGTTGEAPTLTEKEKERIIEIAVEELKGRTQILVGTGSYSTANTIEQTKKAKTLGADAALVITPYYNKPTQEGLFQHFKALSDAVELPICVYNCQSRTGINVHTETLLRIAGLSNVIAVKEASGNVSQMSEVLEKMSPKFPEFGVLSGDDALTLPLLAHGGHGLISVMSNLIPKLMKKLVDAGLEENLKVLRDLHYTLSPAFRGIFLETNPIPIKAAMNFWGLPAGPCRLPLSAMQPENLAKLNSILTDLQNMNMNPMVLG